MTPKTLAIMVGAAALVAAAGASAADLPATQLKVIGLQSHLNSYKTGEVPFWNERIPKESNGKVTVRLTAQDVHGLKGPEILRLMKLGVIDFASAVLSYMAGDNPQFEAIDLPGLSPDMATTKKISEAYKPVLAEIMEKQYGVKLLMLFPSPPQVFWCRSALSGVSDLRGMKVRVFNKAMADMVSGLGATAVTMPFGEVTPSLERKTIDCAITGTLSGNTAKLYEVTSHMYPLYMGWSMHFHGASLNSWNALAPSVQQFLTDQFKWFNDRLWSVVAEEEQDGIDCSIGKDPCKFGYKGNMKLVSTDAAALKAQQEILKTTILPDWGKRCGKECAARYNDTIGKVIGLQIDTGKL